MFFKSIRDEMKAEAFVSHLEFAKQRFVPSDLWNTKHHLTNAQKAFVAMRKAGAEGSISKEGWEYVAAICAELTVSLEACGQAELARDAKYIFDYAAQRAS